VHVTDEILCFLACRPWPLLFLSGPRDEAIDERYDNEQSPWDRLFTGPFK
jgi:hypothetical protein